MQHLGSEGIPTKDKRAPASQWIPLENTGLRRFSLQLCSAPLLPLQGDVAGMLHGVPVPDGGECEREGLLGFE